MMKSTRSVFVFLLTLSGFVENCRGADREFPPRGAPRKSNFGQQQQIAQDLERVVVRFEVAAAGLEEKLARLGRELGNVFSRLDDLDGKVESIRDKLFNDPPNADPSAHLISFDEKISELDRKISKLTNQSDKHFVDTKSESLHLKICDNALAGIEVVAQHFNDSFKSLSEQLQQNIAESVRRLDHLHDRLVENENKTRSRFDEGSLNIQKNERFIDDHTSVINGILSVVRERLKHQPEEEEEASDSGGSSTDIAASFQNFKPVRKTSVAARTGGLSSKNKPAKLNTTSFTTDSLDPRDIRVSKQFVTLFVLPNEMLDEIFVKRHGARVVVGFDWKLSLPFACSRDFLASS